MIVSELWLKSLINDSFSLSDLAEQLTQIGIEVESIELDKTDQPNVTLKIPPNRGDCLSMEGIAREVSVVNANPFQPIEVLPARVDIPDTFPICVETPKWCPQYAARIIKNINPRATLPTWLQERLTVSGLRSVSPIVDIMNYVMLELGQPLHAFDVSKLESEIIVRAARPGEKITLLDNQMIELDSESLIIADKFEPQALAGIMGGLNSSVTGETTDILIESAYFNPVNIRLSAKRLGLRTDASHRFERGISPTLQIRALERATQWVLEFLQGQAGPIIECKDKTYFPKSTKLELRRTRLKTILGICPSDEEVQSILMRLGMHVQSIKDGWQVGIPDFRQDITLEVDLIEEIARIIGLQRIPSSTLIAPLLVYPMPEEIISKERVKQLLVDRGYFEAITYSFIDAQLSSLFMPDSSPLVLSNPIASDMSAMRISIWPGLTTVLHYNQRHQQNRVRLFEMGLCFLNQGPQNEQVSKLAGIFSGSVVEEQWGTQSVDQDFYDIKQDVEALIALTGRSEDFHFEKAEHSALHPSQTAAIWCGDERVGYLGALHPRIVSHLELQGPIYLFELDVLHLLKAKVPKFRGLSKYPVIRRDIALLLDKEIVAEEIKSAIVKCAGSLVRDVIIFDVYQGKGIPPDKKSVALGLILQHPSRTLVESEVNEVMKDIMATLSNRYHATLRE